MEKKATGKIWLSAVLSGMCIMLAGCSDNVKTAGGQSAAETGGSRTEENLSEQEQKIRQYELKYSSGEFEPADYLALAELYGSQGRVRDQRDLLEQSWRLHGDEAAFSALSGITVNAEEEEEAILSQAKLMMQNLGLEEYHNDAVNQISTGEWFSEMMPKLYEGQRNYYLEAGSTQQKIQIKVGYDEAGKPFSEIWHTDGTGQVIYLKKEEKTLRMLMTGLSEGLYQGEFESWLCIAATGDIYHEQGTFSQGVLVGEYTADVYFGKEETDLYTLWHNREGMEFTSYKGEFDRSGKTVLEQPSSGELETVRGTAQDNAVIVYAYDENKKKFLFFSAPEAEEAVFDASVFGIGGLPPYTPYAIYTAPVSSGDGQNSGQESGGSEQGNGSQTGREAQVRIYDGNIEWFDGQIWQVLGTVEAYQEKDPFLAYEQERKAESDAAGGAGEENGGDGSEGEGAASPGTGSIYDRQGAGEIEEPKKTSPKPNKGNNSGSGNSGQTQKPDTGTGGNTGGGTDSGSTGGNTGGGADSGSTGGNTGGGGTGGSTGGNTGSGTDSGGTGGNTGGGTDSGSTGGNTGGGGTGGSTGGNTGGGTDSGSTGGNTGGGTDSGGSGGDVDVEWTPDIM